MEGKILDVYHDRSDTNIVSTIKDLWNDQNFLDITLATVDDHHIKAHRIILSSFSQLFRNILSKYSTHNPLIYLRDIRYKELNKIIQFVYTGQCEVSVLELEDFLTAGSDGSDWANG